MKAVNGVSGKDSLVGINAARSSEAIPLKSVPTLCQFYTARYGRGFFSCQGRWGRCSSLSPRPLCDHQTRDPTDIAETGGRGGGREKKKTKNHPTYTHMRKRNVNAPQPSPPDSLREHQMHASYAAQSRPTWPWLHKAASAASPPGRPPPAGPLMASPEPPSGSLSQLQTTFSG